MSRALDGTNPVAYLGVRPLTPPNMIIPGIRPTSSPRDPTQNDYQYNLGDHWLNTNTEGLWYLAALGSHLVSGVNTRFATWLLISTGAGLVRSLTGNTGGPVFPDINGNINTLGNVASGIVVNGNPGTNTLTWTSSGGGHFGESLTGDTGGAVQFDASGNINVITNNAANNAGATTLIVGNPGTHTLTLNVTDANSNTMIGRDCGNLAESGTGNTGLGNGALLNLSSGDSNTGLGLNALEACSTGNNNTAVGAATLTTTSSGSNNTAVGVSCLTQVTTASFNTGVGSGTTLGLLATGNSNTAVGYGVLDEITTGTLNIGLGAASGNAYTGAESSNIMIGNSGLLGESNVIRLGTDGSGAGQQNLTYMSGDVHCPHNIILDASTSTAATNPFINFSSSNNRISFFLNNVFIGQNSGNTTMTPGVALFNIGIGPSTAQNITTGDRNVGVGNGTNQAITTGQANSSYGYVSLNSLTTGSSNTCYGDSSGEDLVTGSRNILLGQGAGQDYNGAESDNIIIGQNMNSVITVGESNTLRIGAGTGTGSGQQNMAFISGIRGITTGINDAVAVLIDSAGQLGTVSSSIRYKDNIKDMAGKSDPILHLRPVTFHYKKDESKTTQYGLIAEEVEQVFPKLVVYDKDGNADTVKYHELSVLLLNELQKQKKTIDALSRSIQHLENVIQDKHCRC